MKYSEKDIEFANQIITRRNELDNELVEAWMSDPLHVEMLKEFVAIREKYTNWDFEVIKGEERERLQQAISRRKKRQLVRALVCGGIRHIVCCVKCIVLVE